MSLSDYVDYSYFVNEPKDEASEDIKQVLELVTSLCNKGFKDKYEEAEVLLEAILLLIDYSVKIGIDLESIVASELWSKYTLIFEPEEYCEDDLLYLQDQGCSPKKKTLAGGYYVLVDEDTGEILKPLKYVFNQINEEHFNY